MDTSVQPDLDPVTLELRRRTTALIDDLSCYESELRSPVARTDDDLEAGRRLLQDVQQSLRNLRAEVDGPSSGV